MVVLSCTLSYKRTSEYQIYQPISNTVPYECKRYRSLCVTGWICSTQEGDGVGDTSAAAGTDALFAVRVENICDVL
jgi:hypothetical protein